MVQHKLHTKYFYKIYLFFFHFLAEASNGHQPRYKYKCCNSFYTVIVLHCKQYMELMVYSHHGILLCRHNGKSMRVRKMHSGANLINQKLFYGDMLSFIQVAKFDYTISSFSISLSSLQWSLVTVCKINLSIHLIQASGQQIPVVVESCICFINLNGKYSRRKVH